MRLALYFAQHGSLGHTERIFSIFSSLKRKFGKNADILIIHTGKKQPVELNELGKVVNMPFSFGKEFFNKSQLIQEIKNIVKENRKPLKERWGVLKNAILDFDPDVLVTEHFPFGERIWENKEIPPLLEFIRSREEIKVISSRGYPGCIKESYKLIGKYYDTVLFHCTKKDVDFYKSLNVGKLSTKIFSKIIKDFKEKINFTGYIINKEIRLSPEKTREKFGIPKNSKLVVVSRGGGVIYPNIISSSLIAAKKLSNKDIYFLISVGPATDENKFEVYKRFANKLHNVRLFRYAPNFLDCLNASDISINMAGYNTSVQLMWLGKQNICIPLNKPEQRYRSEMMKRLNLCNVLEYASMGSGILIKHIKEMLNNPLVASKKIKISDFNGIRNTLKIMERMKG